MLVGVCGVAAQWLAWRFRLPAIVLLSALGLLLGPVFGWLDPHATLGDTFEAIVRICVVVILFEGGLTLHRRELRGLAQAVWRLVTVGVLLSWIFGTLAAHWVAGLTWPVALVLGAILVVTGPTVVIPMLRQAALNRRTASTIRWEGIINDPVGALLAVLVYEYFVYAGDEPFLLTLRDLGLSVAVSLLVGGGAGYLLGLAIRRGQLSEILKGPVLLTGAITVGAVADAVQDEAGLLAATIMGMTLGNMDLPSIHDIRHFKESVNTLLIAAVFILLTAGADLASFSEIGVRGIAFIAVLMVLVRPLAVWIATIGTELDRRNRLLVGWVAPRGVVAVAIAGVFSSQLVESGYPEAERITPLVLAVVLITVLVHGTTLPRLASALGLAEPRRGGLLIVGGGAWTTALAKVLHDLDVKVLLADHSRARLADAERRDVPVFQGQVLSDHAEEVLELSAISHVLAATDNDAYNALVCSHFAREFGHQRVYQLPLHEGPSDDPGTLARTRRGMVAIGDEWVYEALRDRLEGGWAFTVLRVGAGVRLWSQLQALAEDAVPVVLIRGGEIEAVQASADPITPQEDDLVVVFAPTRAQPEGERLQRPRAEERRVAGPLLPSTFGEDGGPS